jgi:uncharacterized membrane protein
MDTLIPFLKSSSTLDLLVLLLVILIAVVLIPVGILIAIFSRRRMPIYFFLMVSVLPLLLALLGTYLRFIGIEHAIRSTPNVSHEVVAASRQEAWITTYIGAVGTALPFLIGVTGLVLKKDKTT